MLFQLIFMSCIGALIIYLALLVWKKEKITLIHSYHYSKVSEKNKKPYTEKMGKALIIIGVGCILTGVINIVSNTFYGWIGFLILFVWGIAAILKAQKKYNNGLF